MPQKPLNNTKTEANIKTAFANECMALAKYNYYSAKAKAEGYEQIAKIFSETANNESAHAEIWYKQLNDGVATTDVNLGKSAENENFEWSNMYAQFATQAKDEGFDEIATLFLRIGNVEKAHEERFRALLSEIEKGQIFSSADGKAENWICSACGYETQSPDAPDICPICGRPKSYFEIKAENY